MGSISSRTSFLRNTSLRGGHGIRANKIRARRRRWVVELDRLEDRLVLATLSITGGHLDYDASGASSILTVELVNNTTVSFSDELQDINLGSGTSGWTGSGLHTVTGPIGYTAMTIGASDQGQNLTIDYSNGDPLPASGVTYNPSVAVINSNTLTLQGGSFTNEAYAPSATSATRARSPIATRATPACPSNSLTSRRSSIQ